MTQRGDVGYLRRWMAQHGFHGGDGIRRFSSSNNHRAVGRTVGGGLLWECPFDGARLVPPAARPQERFSPPPPPSGVGGRSPVSFELRVDGTSFSMRHGRGPRALEPDPDPERLSRDGASLVIFTIADW